jgi:signal peptidase II
VLWRGLAAAALTTLVDQLSKWAVLGYFREHHFGPALVRVNPYFDLVLTRNTGVSFGILNQTGINSLAFSFAAAIIVLVLIFWLKRAHSGFLAIAIGLIIGGAIGNVLDRLRLGGVVDFLSFHLPVPACSTGMGGVLSGCWPAFNLADSAICLGVGAMLIDGLWSRRAPPQTEGKEDLSS